MLDSPTRRKMISLRLSDVEYETLKTQYRSYGARNVSDLARLALERIMHDPEASAKLKEVDTRLSALEARVALYLDHSKMTP